ncbi:MAG TPA: PAS domain S-box protein, partial [Candidatus Eisenbacteria bacterium]
MPDWRSRPVPGPETPVASLRLGSRLFGIVLLALLPTVGLLLYTSLELRRSAIAGAKADALRLANVAGENQARILEGSRELLSALADLPAIRDVRDPDCRRVLGDLLRGSHSYLNLGVTDTSGQIVCSALPTKSRVDASGRSWFRRAWSTGAFSVGDYQIGAITRKPSVNVATPIRAEDGRMTGVLFAAIDLHTFSELAARLTLPPGASLHVVDGAGVVLARYPDTGPWVGRNSAGEPSTALTLSIRHGTFEAVGLDGVPRLYGTAALPNGGGYVAVGIPKAAALRDADRVFARALGGLLVAALLAFAAAWLLGRRILVHPVAETVAGANRALRSLQAEAVRRERILQTAVDQTEDLVIVADPTGRLVHWNSALERMLGYSPAELPTLHVWDLSPEFPRETWSRTWQTVRETGTLRAQATGRRRDGTVFPADVRVTHVAVGEAEYHCAVVRDVSDSMAAQRAIAEQETRLRAILEHTSNLFYTHTTDHVLTYVSPQARAFLDCEPEEALRRWTDFVTENPVNREGFEATQRAIDTGQRQPRYQLELRTSTGRTRWVEVDEAPVVENGRTIAIVGALTDVTARRQAELERELLENQLHQSQKMEALGRLAGGVAHDFNNLLTAIMGYTQLIALRCDADNPAIRNTEEILKAATRASVLTRQLLTFSRRDMVQPRVFDLNALVQDLAKMLRRLVGEDLEMFVDAGAKRSAVKADPGHIEQV